MATRETTGPLAGHIADGLGHTQPAATCRCAEVARLAAEQERDTDRVRPEHIGEHEVAGGFQAWESEADGLEAGTNGYLTLHKVVATEPWQPSRVRLGERPRVAPATRNRTCEQCGFEFQGTTQSRFCRGEDCDRARAAERKRVSRSQAGQ